MREGQQVAQHRRQGAQMPPIVPNLLVNDKVLNYHQIPLRRNAVHETTFTRGNEPKNDFRPWVIVTNNATRSIGMKIVVANRWRHFVVAKQISGANYKRSMDKRLPSDKAVILTGYNVFSEDFFLR